MKTKCIVITNKNSWVSEPIINELNTRCEIDLLSVVFFNLKGNWKLVKRRYKQYGFREFTKKVFVIFLSKILWRFKFSRKSDFFYNSSFQTVINNKINYKISSNLNNSETIRYINDLQPDIILVFSCSQILSNTFLSNKKIKYINLHDSLLPKHKGPSPSFWVLYNRDKISGFTIHFIKQEVDSGEIIYREIIEVGEVRSEEELIKKIISIATSKIIEILLNIQNNIKPEYEIFEVEESYEGIPDYYNRKKLSKMLKHRQ